MNLVARRLWFWVLLGILGMALVPTNVIGNAIATLVIARWEGAIDEGIRAATVGRRRAMPENRGS